MSFMKEVINSSLDIWNSYLKHPFIRELALGILDEEKFKGYIIDDSIYLREYARIFAYSMYKSKRMEDIKFFYNILSFVNEGESSTRIYYLEKFGLTQDEIEEMEPRPENKAYIDFMRNIALNYDISEILMAVLPCMLSYNYIANHVVKSFPEIKNNFYWRFIKDYITEQYSKGCIEWSKFAEEKCKQLDTTRKNRLIKIFRTSSEHELYFWDMSYRER